jgi:hypothetical protein
MMIMTRPGAFGTGKDLFCTTLKDDVLHDISHLLAVGFAGLKTMNLKVPSGNQA